jgi:hypothetical protein
MEGEGNTATQDERDEDEGGIGLGLEGDNDVDMDEVSSVERDTDESDQEESDQKESDQEESDQEESDQEESDQEGSDQQESDQEDDEDLSQEDFGNTNLESPALRRSQRLQYRAPTFDEPMDMEGQRSGTPPPPEEEQKEPWHFSNVEEVRNWREFCRDEIFQNIHQVEEDPIQENVSSKRGKYKSTTVGLDKTLESSCARRFVEWRRTMADGLSNEALDGLLDILHSPDCNNDLLPRNHYHLEQLQDRALAPYKPRTTRWRIPKQNNGLESEEIIITDIEHLLSLQLQDPEIGSSIITEYNYNDGLVNHPSHGELWKKLAAHDTARDSHPLCLKVFT